MSTVTDSQDCVSDICEVIYEITPNPVCEILADIFENTERPDKIAVAIDRISRDITIVYQDLDDSWFKELAEALGQHYPKMKVLYISGYTDNEIVQHGVNKEIGKTPIENDSVSSFNEDTKTGNWSFNDLNKYIEEIRGSPEKIDFISLFNNIDPNCEVYYYINGDKISSEDITTFINKVKFGGTERLVPNSLKYNPQGKLIEFGQE